MRRRDLIALGAAALAGWPRALGAHQKKAPRIGFLATGSLDETDSAAILRSFYEGLRERGYVVGHDVIIEFRYARGDVDRFPALARELVELKIDVIVASNSLAARAALKATRTIPIIVPVMGDPLGDGLVSSLARPGANVTGLTFLGPELLPKRLALLKEALPGISRVVALWHPGAYGDATMRDMRRETESAAQSLNVRLKLVDVHGADELERAFSIIAGDNPDALLVFPSPMLYSYRRRIVELAAKHRLPSIGMDREFPEFGGFMSYGPSIGDLFRRAATYVDKVLKGAQPRDLPVEQAIKFELVINLKTAKALGLAVPEALLARADEVID
jgi:putative ABC transport system substrate-binding protein